MIIGTCDGGNKNISHAITYNPSKDYEEEKRCKSNDILALESSGLDSGACNSKVNLISMIINVPKETGLEEEEEERRP